MITDPFTEEQVDWVLKELKDIWMKNSEDLKKMGDYIWKVILPECLIKLYSDLFEISKPRIALLVLLTTFTGMWLAGSGYVALDLVIYTLIGTGLASAASGALNNYVDREVDKLMARTRNRALPTSRLHPQQALWLA